MKGGINVDKIFNLEEFAGGALAEHMDREVSKVLSNIYDPNTDAEKARKITLTISFKPTSDRGLAAVSIQAKSSLQPLKAIETSIIIDRDMDTGMVVAAERRNKLPGQLEICTENPSKPEVKSDANVIDLKAMK